MEGLSHQIVANGQNANKGNGDRETGWADERSE
jgi:hypothetical protein